MNKPMTKKELKEAFDKLNSYSNHQRAPILYISEEHYDQFWKDLEDWLSTNEKPKEK